jgi:hypothetical protein
LGDTIDRVLGRLGSPSRAGVEVVFDRWDEVVGDAMAARTRPVGIDGETLVVSCDDPALTTHVRFLECASTVVGAVRDPRGAAPVAADRGARPSSATSHPSGRLPPL